MTDESLRLRVGVYNLRDGGIYLADESRLDAQIDMLEPLGLDLLALLEAKWGGQRDDRRRYVAAQLGMNWSCRVPSNFHGCDIAMFARRSPLLRVGKQRHQTGPPFVHCHGNLELKIAGQPRPLRFMAGHLAPSSPAARLAEAETVGVYRNEPLIYVGDFNAVALDENPDVTGIDPVHSKRKLDKGAAQALAEVGFIDIGAHLKDPTPTVGHTRTDRLAYRCDRIYTNLPTDTITGYGVIQTDDDLSDHRAVWADFTIAPAHLWT